MKDEWRSAQEINVAPVLLMISSLAGEVHSSAKRRRKLRGRTHSERGTPEAFIPRAHSFWFWSRNSGTGQPKSSEVRSVALSHNFKNAQFEETYRSWRSPYDDTQLWVRLLQQSQSHGVWPDRRRMSILWCGTKIYRSSFQWSFSLTCQVPKPTRGIE